STWANVPTATVTRHWTIRRSAPAAAGRTRTAATSLMRWTRRARAPKVAAAARSGRKASPTVATPGPARHRAPQAAAEVDLRRHAPHAQAATVPAAAGRDPRSSHLRYALTWLGRLARAMAAASR